MYTISCETHFDAAHFLYGYDGPCKSLHGHRWTVRAYVSGDRLIENGSERDMLVDFSILKSALSEIADKFDHKLVVEAGTLRSSTKLMLEEEKFDIMELDSRPTAEKLAEYFFGELREKGIAPSKVRVFESPDSFAEYSE